MKRLIAILLAVVLVAGGLGGFVYAQEDPVNEVHVHFWSGYNYAMWGNNFTDHEVTGYMSCGTGFYNTDDTSNLSVTDLAISLTSDVEFDRVYPQPATVDPPTYEWFFGDIPEALSEFDQGGARVSKADPTPFYPGFDASRSVDKTEFSAPDTQYLRITIMPRQPWQSIVVSMEGFDNELVSTVIASVDYDDTDPKQHIALDPDGQKLLIFMDNPVVGKPYTYDVTIGVTPKVDKLEFMPPVYIQGSDQIAWDKPEGSSFSRTIAGLGTWTYSAQGNYVWGWNDRERRGLNLRSYSYIPMEDFAIKHMSIDFDRRPDNDKIAITEATFSLRDGATYDLAIDDVIVSIDGLDITIPAGSFVKKGNNERYTFVSHEGVEPKVKMMLDFDKGEWSFKVSKIDASVVDNYDGVDVVFCIGYMAAIERINMQIGGLSYIAEY